MQPCGAEQSLATSQRLPTHDWLTLASPPVNKSTDNDRSVPSKEIEGVGDTCLRWGIYGGLICLGIEMTRVICTCGSLRVINICPKVSRRLTVLSAAASESRADTVLCVALISKYQ